MAIDRLNLPAFHRSTAQEAKHTWEHFTSGPNQRAYACTLHNSLTSAMKKIGRKREKKKRKSKGAAAHASSLITSFLYDRITATSEILNYPLPYYTITPGDRLAY